MKILAHCTTYGRNSASGADKMLQAMLEYLGSRNCECRAVIDDAQDYELNGVQVSTNKVMLGEHYDWCDVVIIHLVALHEAVTIARRFKKPVIHICHNAHIRPSEGNVIYNSKWLADAMNLNLPSIVVHPPTKVKNVLIDHYGKPFITLINTCKNKGGDFLVNLSRQMPQYKFMGVYGGYGFQMMQPVPNLNYRPYNSAGVDYSDTKIVIIPSKQESWSLAASEAMAHGIPVICSALPGLRENCGSAAVYATSLRDYVDEIMRLDNYDYYTQRARDGFARVRLHNYNDELNNMFNFIENIVLKSKYVSGTIKVEKWMLKDIAEIENELTKAEHDKFQAEQAKQAEKVNKIPVKKMAARPKEKKEYKGLPTQTK